jgi:hypothetical protein
LYVFFFLEIYFINFIFIYRRIDNDSDQESNQDLDLETDISHPESIHREHPISTEFNSNGHEYILVNGSINNHIISRNENEN